MGRSIVIYVYLLEGRDKERCILFLKGCSVQPKIFLPLKKGKYKQVRFWRAVKNIFDSLVKAEGA